MDQLVDDYCYSTESDSQFLSAAMINDLNKRHFNEEAVLTIATHWGLRTVSYLPINPYFLARELGLNAGNKKENMGRSVIRSQERKWREQLVRIRVLEEVLNLSEGE